MIYLFAFMALVVIGGLTLEILRLRSVYEALYQIILADRDAAREEVKTVRAALFPQLRQNAQPAAKPAPAFTGPPPLPRGPWRINFRKLVNKYAAPQPAAKETPHA